MFFTVDPTREDPGEFGEPIVYTDALYQASLGKASVDDEPYEDRWGRFYSAYSSVFDSKGNVGGIVAVDFAADWYEHQITTQIRTILLITVISLVFVVLIISVIATRSRNRIRSLYKELNNLSDGIEELVNELSEDGVSEGTELLHSERQTDKNGSDEVSAIGDKIRSLQKYMRIKVDHVRKKAYRDGLNGMENRTAYLEYIRKLDDRIEKNDTNGFAVAMFDINGLKDVNDNKGHESGDSLIRASADLIVNSFEGARTFRIGGDEFVAILESGKDGIEKLFEKYEKNAAEQKTENSRDPIMAGGYALFAPEKDTCFDDTFKRADTQMYESKKEYYRKYGKMGR